MNLALPRVVMRMHARTHWLALALLVVGCGSPDWNRHDAHRDCAAAIDAWPGTPSPPCSALHMCANEAQLTPAQRTSLEAMMRHAHCEEP